MSFSAARSLRLLLLLAPLCLSGADPAASTASTKTTNQQTRESISSRTGSAYSTQNPVSTAATKTTNQRTPESIASGTVSEYSTHSLGVPHTTEDATQQTKEKKPDLEKTKYNITIEKTKYNITIKGFSTTAVVKNITLAKPTSLDLLCILDINPSTDKKTAVEVTWKRGNITIEDNNITKDENQNIWSTEYTVNITNKDELGNYSCVFKAQQEAEGRFNVRVPEVGGKSKSLISYEGDSVVMTCTSGSYDPLDWVWYTMNGTEQAVINVTQSPEKYQLLAKHPNETKLKVLDLAENDGGSYLCTAVFWQLGESRGKASLKVLSYMAPLKPFLAIAAEVIILVAIIFIYEVYTKKKEPLVEGEKELEHTEQLKSEDSNGVENSTTTRHRKV